MQPQAKLKDITRLLASWPSANGEGAEQLRSYLLAVEDYPPGDVEAGINSLIKGNAPGVNPNFLPPPAVVGGECRRMMNLRLESERRNKLRQPALPPPDVEIGPEERARVKAKIDAFLADQAVEPTDQAAVKRRNDQWARTNARFAPDMTNDAMMERLIRKRGYSAGDPEADAA